MVRRFCALPFLRPDDVTAGYNAAVEMIPTDDDDLKGPMESLAAYVDKNWTSARASFPNSIWTRFEVTGMLFNFRITRITYIPILTSIAKETPILTIIAKNTEDKYLT